MPQCLQLAAGGKSFKPILEAAKLSDKLVIVMSNTPRTVPFFGAAIANADKEKYVPPKDYTQEMLTWYVVCKLTSHDHFFTHYIKDPNDVSPLFPFITPVDIRIYKFPSSNNLVKTFLTHINKMTGRRLPSDT